MTVERRLPDTVRLVAEQLESFGSSRAHFGELEDSERIAVARRIAIHLSRQRVDGPIMDKEPHMFFHICGSVGIDFDEAEIMWQNATENMLWEDVYASRES